MTKKLLNPPPQQLPVELASNANLAQFFTELTRSLYQVFFEASQFSVSIQVDIIAADGITPTSRINRVQGSGGGVTITATPSISAGRDGDELILKGGSDSSTVTLQDESNLARSGLALGGGSNVVLGLGDTIHLFYDADDAKWYEIARSDN